MERSLGFARDDNPPRDQDTYSGFFTAATAKIDGWEYLKQGLFDSSYAKYEKLNKRAEEYYMHNRRFYLVVGRRKQRLIGTAMVSWKRDKKGTTFDNERRKDKEL